jgi:hypothetical protein
MRQPPPVVVGCRHRVHALHSLPVSGGKGIARARRACCKGTEGTLKFTYQLVGRECTHGRDCSTDLQGGCSQ